MGASSDRRWAELCLGDGCRGLLAAVVVLLVLLVQAGLAAPAGALTPGPGWQLTARDYPTNLPPGGSGVIRVDVANVGSVASSGTITLTDTLPPGVTAVAVGQDIDGEVYVGEQWNCAGTTVITCTNDPNSLPSIEPGRARPVSLGIEVAVAPDASGSPSNQVTISGGGAPGPASTSDPLTISSAVSSFGLAGFRAWFSSADGTTDTQAGSHPYTMTVALDLNSGAREERNGAPHEEPYVVAGGEPRNIDVDLPPGIIGNPQAVPRCTRQKFDARRCPVDTQVGVDTAYLGEEVQVFSVFNLVPPKGIPAQFGFSLVGISTFLDASVRSDGDYGISVHTDNIAQREVLSDTTTLWGVPSDPSHDAQREAIGCENGCESNAPPVPFLTLPTACAGPQTFSADAVAWQDPSLMGGLSTLSQDSNGTPVGFTGCDHLAFNPSITVAPDTSAADTPAGLTVDVRVPQEGLVATEGLASADLKDTTVTLPAGLVINPGQAAGLAACQASEDGVGREGPPSCPSASRVGTDEIETPLLSHALKGDVYVLQSDPPNLQLLVAASGEGVDLKLVGDVHLDEVTGRITTTFKETPELPFTDFKLVFSGGAQAALATPAACGTYTTGADFTPWSTPSVPDAVLTDSFAIDRGPGGSACSLTLPFTPTLTAGSTTDQAGGYTGFSLLLQRDDAQQRISTLSFKTPEGLLGMISRVPLCEEPQAAAGTCSAVSQIGHTVVAAGPGPYPLVVPEAGQPPAPIYLTAGYKGAPYGLSIVVPVVAGPFNLGTVVVRATIAVDPHTAQLTVTTDPLPAILDGIPTDLRTINALIDRPGFMFNPTSCASQSFGGTATSTEGATAAISSHFQVGSCQALKFKPDFKVSTSGRTSRKEGAGLDAKILYPTGGLGANQASSQSNIASVKVDLPKQLPARLTTLQKACVAAVFEANPASCPKASVVGHATAVTPVLPVPLSGPAYFVSHGGEAFPSLIVVLQGYGVTVDLVGTTFINSKTSITSSTFKQVPDVPIASFELSLPKGPNSALAANLPSSAKGSFCGQALAMPTAFVAQNGAVIHQSTKMTVSGCTKAKHAKKVTKQRRAKQGKDETQGQG